MEGHGPVILTCEEHNKGTDKFYIHPCRWKHNLPSRHPDQICQTVVNPRVLKPMRTSFYSTSYQLFQQKGTFNGIDTCSATMFGQYHLPPSLLLSESESRSIYNRHDIKSHIESLRKEGAMSDIVAQSKIDAVKEF